MDSEWYSREQSKYLWRKGGIRAIKIEREEEGEKEREEIREKLET